MASRSGLIGPIFERRSTEVAGHGRAVRLALGGLLGFGALNAFAGGYYGMAGAENVPLEWLEGTPFDDYFVPSLILFVAVGGTFAFAAAAVLAKWRIGRAAAFTAGGVVLLWLAVETAMIGYVSWMQPATTVGALLVLLLAWRYRPEARANLS